MLFRFPETDLWPQMTKIEVLDNLFRRCRDEGLGPDQGIIVLGLVQATRLGLGNGAYQEIGGSLHRAVLLNGEYDTDKQQKDCRTHWRNKAGAEAFFSVETLMAWLCSCPEYPVFFLTGEKHLGLLNEQVKSLRMTPATIDGCSLL